MLSSQCKTLRLCSDTGIFEPMQPFIKSDTKAVRRFFFEMKVKLKSDIDSQCFRQGKV